MSRSKSSGSTPEKLTTKVSPAPDKKSKAAARKGRVRKGKSVKAKAEPHWRPLKEDREAFAEGRLTVAAKRMTRMVDQAFKANGRRGDALEKFEAAMDKIYAKVANGNDRGVTIVSADMKRRVIFQKKNLVAGNQNAHMAKNLINEYVSEMLGRNTLSKDDQQMAEFLGNVITESKGRIMLTKNLITFRRLEFTDQRLIDAQKLLNDAFDVTESKLYVHCEQIGKDGKWVKA